MVERNISQYYLFLSKNLITLFYNIPFKNIINFIKPICCRKIYDQPNDILIKKVYFRNISPLRKENQNKQLITGINKNNIRDTWNICNPKIGDFIEVHYNVPFENLQTIIYKPYIISYVYPCNIHFPPYSIEELRFYYEKSNYKNGMSKNDVCNGVLFASCGEEYFTDEAIKLSGPFGNFYSDLPMRFGIRITRKILIIDKIKEDLIITDNNGNEIKVTDNNIIKL